MWANYADAKEPRHGRDRQGMMKDLSAASYRNPRLLAVAALTLGLIVVAGCSRIVGPRSFAMSAVTVTGETWSVNVNDTSGAVTNASIDPTPLFIDATGLPFNPPGSSDTVVIPWTGGACDRITTFNVSTGDGGGLGVSYKIQVAPGNCDAIGVLHQLVLTTSPAVPAGRVMVTRAP
jgi:hypothetical protein